MNYEMTEMPQHPSLYRPQSHPVDYSRMLARSPVFLATLGLAVVAWLISLVSQAVVTHNLGNAFVGTLWFAIILQLGIIISLVFVLRTNTLIQHGIPLAILAALTTSFAAAGVDRNIFAGAPSQKALSAGWLITCIVDVVWIVLLGSEPSALTFRFIASPGSLRRPAETATPAPPVQSVSTNLDAFAPKYEMTPIENTNPEQANLIPAAGNGDANRQSRSRDSAAADPETQRRRSAGVWNTYSPPQSTADAGSAKNVPLDPNPPPVPAATDPAGPDSTKPSTHASEGDQNQPVTSNASTHTDVKTIGKATALFDYVASPDDPYEVSFKKHEELGVVDMSGKWWEVINAAGKKGIAPSNYLKML